MTVPQTAITANPYGDIAFVVEKKEGSSTGLSVKQVFVKTGENPRRSDRRDLRPLGGRPDRRGGADEAAQRLAGHRQQCRPADEYASPSITDR